MRKTVVFAFATILSAILMTMGISSGFAAGGKGAKSLSAEEQVRIARSAAPSRISTDAAVMVYGKDGKLMEVKKGTNGFTCVPDIEGQETPDPICMDRAAYQWLNDAMMGAPKPTNTVPGIAYMARGGWHWEKNGKITPATKNEPGAKRVKEPPHWMILWPFDSKTTAIPSISGRSGTYIMYEGTPYAHLMIYQDPNRSK
ncbi:MAG: hypothetical protein HY890_02315 [Deltaproteobacteria bacterium]|nr:hypothetical protein [Deltaproteobacteria bacterium]